MDEILNCIELSFGVSGESPSKSSLVDNDGYDELDKESATDFFAGKDWSAVLEHLRIGGAYFLDEWSVLNVPSLSYYARAYLEYFLENLFNKDPDEEYIYFMLGALYQIVYIHKGSPLSEKQTKVITSLVKLAVKKSEEGRFFKCFQVDIPEYANKFLEEHKRHGG